MKHIVMPHFSDEDRIGIAFNSKFDFNYHYDDIYPKPYWLPIKYTYEIDLDDYDQKNKCFNIKFCRCSFFMYIMLLITYCAAGAATEIATQAGNTPSRRDPLSDN